MMDKATALAELYDIVKNQSEAYYAHLASGGRADPEYEKSMAAIQFAYLYLRDPESLRPKGRWEDEHGGKYANPRYRCSVCKEKALYKFERDTLGNWKEVQALTPRCPNCGADMRED